MPLAPLRLRPVRRLLFAYGVNQLGDWAAELALAVAVFATTRSPLAVVVTFVVHRALLGLLAPLLVARLESLPAARVLPAIYLFQAAIFVVLAATATQLGLLVVLPLVAVDGLLAPTARALARTGLVALTKPRGLHRDVNAVVNVIFTFNGMMAPAIGGLLVALAGPEAALLIDSFSFLAAARAVGRVPWPEHAGPAETDNGRQRLRAALDYVSHRPLLRRMLIGEAWLTVFLTSILPIEVVFVTETVGAGNGALGAVLAAWGIGMVVGGGALARLPRARLTSLLLFAAVVQSVSCLGMGASASLASVLAWSAIGGIGNGMYGVTFLTALQERVADEFQARVNGLYEALGGAAPAIGFTLGGILAAAASPRAVYMFAGAGALAVLVWAVLALRDADWRLPSQPTPGPEPAMA